MILLILMLYPLSVRNASRFRQPRMLQNVLLPKLFILNIP
jgi:hypothetical protein